MDIKEPISGKCTAVATITGSTIVATAAKTNEYRYASFGEKSKEEKDEKTGEISQPLTVSKTVDTKIPSQIIRNANVNFQVENTDSSHARIAALLGSYQAYFGSDERTQNAYSIQQNMVIRVPAEHFDQIMEQIMKESIYTNSKSITAEDVTEEFVNTESRLKSKKEVEKRYLELLARAQKVIEVLEVENNLRVIHEEIDATEGRLKLLKDRVAYSTITLVIDQKVKGSLQPEMVFSSRFGAARIRGWHRLQNSALAVVASWPLLLVLLSITIWIMIRIRKRRNRQ